MNMKLPLLILLILMLAITQMGLSQQNTGCSLNIDDAELEKLNPSRTTGIQQLDKIINLDMFALYELFGVKADIFMYQDNERLNARALPDIVSDERLPDGTIIFGVNLMKDEFRKSATGLGFAIPGIIAHEMGHILQYSKNCKLPVMQMELQADFLAGYYLSVRSDIMRRKGIPVITFAPEAFKSFFEKGDYEFNNPQHHGTPDQRLAATTAGYNCDLTDIDEIYAAGEKFVTKSDYISKENQDLLNKSYSYNLNNLKRIIDIFENRNFEELLGNEITDSDDIDASKALRETIQRYKSKIKLMYAFEPDITATSGDILHHDSKIRYYMSFFIGNTFNTDLDLAKKNMEWWTVLLNEVFYPQTPSESFKEDRDKSNINRKKWTLTKSPNIINVNLNLSDNTKHHYYNIILSISDK